MMTPQSMLQYIGEEDMKISSILHMLHQDLALTHEGARRTFTDYQTATLLEMVEARVNEFCEVLAENVKARA